MSPQHTSSPEKRHYIKVTIIKIVIMLAAGERDNVSWHLN